MSTSPCVSLTRKLQGPGNAPLSCTHSEIRTTTTRPSHTSETWWPWIGDKVVGPSFVGLVIALAGVIIARSNDRYKARREYLASAVDKLSENLEALREAASKYWTMPWSDKECPPLEAEIEYRLQVIGGLIEVTAPDLWRATASPGPRLQTDLAGAVNPGNFAVPGRPANPQAARATAVAASNLVYELVTELGRFHNAPLPARAILFGRQVLRGVRSALPMRWRHILVP